MAINLFHIYPMFHAVDSDIMNKAHGLIGNAANLSDVSVDAADAMQHGVHKNLLEHKLSLREHLEQRQQKQQLEQKAIDEVKVIENESGEVQNGEEISSSDKNQNDTSGRGPMEDVLENVNQKLARGFSGLPMEETPALIGAKRGTIECDADVK